MPADEPDVLALYVSLGHINSQELTLRMSPELVDEVLPLLDEHGIRHGQILEFSAGTTLWIEGVQVLAGAGGLAALASIIHTVVRRHDTTKVLIERPDGEKTEVTGLSLKQIEQFLQKRAEQQKARDAEVERMFKKQDESE